MDAAVAVARTGLHASTPPQPAYLGWSGRMPAWSARAVMTPIVLPAASAAGTIVRAHGPDASVRGTILRGHRPAASAAGPRARRTWAAAVALAAITSLALGQAMGQGFDRSSGAPGPPRRTPSTVPTGLPYTPESDARVLQKVPSSHDSAWQRIGDLRRRLAADPRNVRAADALARAYLDYGRTLGDARYAGYAEAVIAPWTARPDPPPAVLVTQATILQYRHEFAPARALLARAVAADGALAQAWLTLAALDLVEGDPAAAAGHCRRAGRRAGLAWVTACEAAVRLATGDAAQAQALLTAVDAEGLSPPLRAWIAGLAADAAQRLAHWAAAETAYRRGLAALPGDNFLLVGYADFLLARDRARDVLPLLTDAADSDTAYLRLAIANVVLRTPDAARLRWTMAARLAAYAQRGDATAGREEARFHLDVARDPAAALVAARRNFGQQRELEDARLLLASALAAQQPQAAQPVLDFIARTGLADPRLDELADRARRDLADRRKAP